MVRSILVWSVLCIAVAIGLLVVKQRVQEHENRLEALGNELAATDNAIAVLRAEWSYLNQPARLEDLAIRHLGLEPPLPSQIRSVRDFLERSERKESERKEPERQPAPRQRPAQRHDWLGPILSSLKDEQ